MTIAKTKTGQMKAGDVEAIDVLAKPQVAIPDPTTLTQARSMLGRDGDAPIVTADTTTTTTTTEEDAEQGEEEEPEAEGEGGEEEETEAAAEDGEAGDGDDDEEEEEPEASATTPAAEARARVTSGDVLKAVRELTGEASPVKQLGALRAMRVNAARTAKAEKRAETASRKAIVEKAVRDGKLPPAQRQWAMSTPRASLDAYLKNAAPVVRRNPLRQLAPKGPKGATAGEPVITAECANIAKQMGMDPKALANHHKELVDKGVLVH